MFSSTGRVRHAARRTLTLVLILLPLLFSSAFASNPAVGQRHVLRLQVGTFDPLLDRDPAARTQLADAVEPGPYYIVQFNGSIAADWLAQLERLGANVLGYVPDNSAIVRVAPEDVAKVKEMYAIRWMGSYRAAYKIAPSLAKSPALRTAASTPEEVLVAAFPGESLAATEQFLRSQGAMIRNASETPIALVIDAVLPATSLPAVVQHPSISWVEPLLPMSFDNNTGREIMNVESVWSSFGYFGAGQIVAVSDSGLSVQNAMSPDFAGRVVRAYAPSEMNLADAECQAKTDSTDLNGHGTHVAGSILGNGSASGSNPAARQYTNSYAGAAPEARLVFMALNTDGSGGIQCIDDTNADFLAKGYQNGARISSNSWGGPTGGTRGNPQFGGYTFLSRLVDNYIWEHKDYLVLYAAGNSGDSPSTIGSPGTAKNVLTIGASENRRADQGAGLGPGGSNISDDPDTMAYFSSRGPTADGRVKPEVAAPGTRIISVLGAQAGEGFSDNQIAPGQPYAYSDGTSMATPMAAGAAALMREWLGKERGMPNPSAAFMKALIIHGALRLPNSTLPNFDSGWGRLDAKNTLTSKYVLFDDNLQGLTTGQNKTYTVEVSGSTQTGTLFRSQPAAAVALSPAAANTFALQPLSAPSGEGVPPEPGSFTLDPAPGHERATERSRITTTGKNRIAAGNNGMRPPVAGQNSGFGRIAPVADGVTTQSFLQGMVGGGDFEEPNWTDYWSQIWFGFGVPTRTDGSDGGRVLAGSYSVWLGGSPSDDSIWYPVSFPAQIDSDFASGLEFLFRTGNADPGYDSFCVAIVDDSGYVVGDLQRCFDGTTTSDGIYSFKPTFTSAQKQALAGVSGNLVLYTVGDGAEPHLSAFVDNVALAVDFPDVTLDATPESGPAGTTFLFTGSYNVPYGPVEVCVGPCTSTSSLGTVYADERGDIAAYLETKTTAAPGRYPITSRNIAGRTASTTITISGASAPRVTATPASGQPGTQFTISGANFLPNDDAISVTLNETSLGTAGSNSSGAVTIRLNTSSNTPAGTYSVEMTDSAGRSATTQFTVVAGNPGSATMTVSPASGAPGATFTFVGSNFVASTPVSFSLDNESIGEIATDAAGSFSVSLQTKTTTAPGSYTLLAQQGATQASAQFQVVGGGSGGGGGQTPSGNGLYITLAWTDPPAETGAAVALVNNLDLRVEGPGGPYLGNNRSDAINNVETVRIENPVAGTYTITVAAAGVSGVYGAQPFALVATIGQNYGTGGAVVGASGGRRMYLPLATR